MICPKRGEVWYANIPSSVGSEQSGRRPVLVIQNNIGNQYSPTVIVAPLTGKKKKWMPTHVLIRRCYNGLIKNSIVLLEQIRTLDKKALDTKIATLDSEELTRIDDAIKISLCIY